MVDICSGYKNIHGRRSIHSIKKIMSDLSDEERSDLEEENTENEITDDDDEQVNKNVNKHRKKKEKIKDTSSSYIKDLLIKVSLLFCIVATIFKLFLFTNTKEIYDTEQGMLSLKNNYPDQDKMFWDYIEYGINEINRTSQTKSFIFLYSENSIKSQNIVKNIASFASKSLDSNKGTALELSANILSKERYLRDHGYLVEDFRENLTEHRAMVVTDLQDIPGEVVRGFHSFCDEYSPLVKKSIIMFTLKVDDVEQFDDKMVENFLIKKWENVIELDTLQALVIRLMGQVLKIHNS